QALFPAVNPPNCWRATSQFGACHDKPTLQPQDRARTRHRRSGSCPWNLDSAERTHVGLRGKPHGLAGGAPIRGAMERDQDAATVEPHRRVRAALRNLRKVELSCAELATPVRFLFLRGPFRAALASRARSGPPHRLTEPQAAIAWSRTRA